jgi:TonB family protein
MTRSLLVAALALTPALLHAQAASPAQNLQARLAPVSAIKSDLKADGKATATATTKVRVSTGVVAPRLLAPVDLSMVAKNRSHVVSQDIRVVVTMTVDESGKPAQLAVAQSANENLDQEVLAVLGQARFQPGTLDGQPFPLPVRMQVIIPRGTEY